MARRVPQEIKAASVLKVRWDHRDLSGTLVRKVTPDLRETPARLDPSVPLVTLGQKVRQDRRERKEIQAPKETLVLKETSVPKERSARLVLKAPREMLDQQDLRETSVQRECRDQQGPLGRKVQRVRKVNRVSKARPVRTGPGSTSKAPSPPPTICLRQPRSVTPTSLRTPVICGSGKGRHGLTPGRSRGLLGRLGLLARPVQ